MVTVFPHFRSKLVIWSMAAHLQLSLNLHVTRGNIGSCWNTLLFLTLSSTHTVITQPRSTQSATMASACLHHARFWEKEAEQVNEQVNSKNNAR